MKKVRFARASLYLTETNMLTWICLVEGKIREMIDWRITSNVDQMLSEYVPPRALLYYVPSAILKGYDKDGE